MILIFSSDSDYSTTKVIEWLRFYKTEFIRINAEDLLRNEVKVIIENNIFHVKLSYNDHEIDLERVKKIWYRGGNLIRNIPNTLLNLEDTELRNVLIKNLSSENNSLIEFFYDYTTKTNNIGSYSTYQLNKLHCLKVASSNGLNVPNTIVTTTKKEVMEFKKKNQRVITKGIQEVFEGYYQSYGYYSATEAITDNCIDEMPDVFFSSLAFIDIEKQINGKGEPIKSSNSLNNITIKKDPFGTIEIENKPQTPQKLPSTEVILCEAVNNHNPAVDEFMKIRNLKAIGAIPANSILLGKAITVNSKKYINIFKVVNTNETINLMAEYPGKINEGETLFVKQ